MDLSVIFNAIVPDNIKSLPLVKVCSEIFIKQLNRNAQVSLNIRKLFDVDNNKFIETDSEGNVTELTDSDFIKNSKDFLKAGLFYTYIHNVSSLIFKLQKNNILDRNVLKTFNSEYLGCLREYQKYIGTEKAIKYMYAFAKYLETGKLTRDLTLEQGSVFNLRYDGSLPNNIFTMFNKPIAHPCGWLCEYEKLGIPPEPTPTPPEPPAPVDNLILDCDFDDGNFTDKMENYELYGSSGEPDVNGNTWYTITDELEFGDYHYDCNPDFSVPVISDGSGSDDSYLINPYQIWILADGWDNLWIEKGSSDVCKLNKIGDYFIYSIADIRYSYEYFNSFFESNDLQEKTKSTLELTSDKNPQSYYGKIIKITENSSTIEVIGDINA